MTHWLRLRPWLLAAPLALAIACNGTDDETDDTTETEDTDDTNPPPVDADEDGYDSEEDCNDNDPAIYPGAPEDDCTDPVDYNCDGETPLYADVDEDGWAACEDCNDEVDAINPDAIEACDGVDNDCDDLTDEEDDDLVDAQTFYQDLDKDGYGDSEVSEIACEASEGFVMDDTDCDDDRKDIHPDADEICDDEDNDCDGDIDDEDEDVVDQVEWFPDVDEDGLGDPDAGVFACDAPEGYIENGRDCDDKDREAGEASDWYLDRDGDKYGVTSLKKTACVAPKDYVALDGDCDDKDTAVHPGATEICDEKDNDCDGDVDDDDADVTGLTDWFPDKDEDEYGDEDAKATAACAAPKGYVEDDTDCDDADRLVHPGLFDWDDDKDNDCDTKIDEDVGLETYTHDSDIQSIWNSNCTRCHGASGGLSLASSAHGKIVNVSSSIRSGMDYIEPGDPDNSYLWHKLNNTHIAAGGTGSSMPYGAGSLSTSLLDKIETWIEEGAVK